MFSDNGSIKEGLKTGQYYAEIGDFREDEPQRFSFGIRIFGTDCDLNINKVLHIVKHTDMATSSTIFCESYDIDKDGNLYGKIRHIRQAFFDDLGICREKAIADSLTIQCSADIIMHITNTTNKVIVIYI